MTDIEKIQKALNSLGNSVGALTKTVEEAWSMYGVFDSNMSADRQPNSKNRQKFGKDKPWKK